MAPRIYIARPPQNPILAFFYLIAAGVVVVAALLMGAVILSVVFGLALIAGLVVWIRIWWLRRKIMTAQGGPSAQPRQGGSRDSESGVEITSVEYEVVDERDDNRPGH
jgi:uncharacterized iron-regulated membrane protein